jgi:hypothetical protein
MDSDVESMNVEEGVVEHRLDNAEDGVLEYERQEDSYSSAEEGRCNSWGREFHLVLQERGHYGGLDRQIHRDADHIRDTTRVRCEDGWAPVTEGGLRAEDEEEGERTYD